MLRVALLILASAVGWSLEASNPPAGSEFQKCASTPSGDYELCHALAEWLKKPGHEYDRHISFPAQVEAFRASMADLKIQATANPFAEV